MPKIKFLIVIISCFIIFFSQEVFAQSFQRTVQGKELDPEALAAQAAERAAKAEERRLKAEKRIMESRGVKTPGAKGEKEGEAAEEVVEDTNRGAAFSLESLGKNDTRQLSLGAIRDIMVGRLELLRNDRFTVGSIFEINEDNAALELLTAEGALVQYVVVDRKTGSMFFSRPDYKPEPPKYDPKDYNISVGDAQVMFQKIVEYERVIEEKFGDKIREKIPDFGTNP